MGACETGVLVLEREPLLSCRLASATVHDYEHASSGLDEHRNAGVSASSGYRRVAHVAMSQSLSQRSCSTNDGQSRESKVQATSPPLSLPSG